jgi:cyanophycin synthetase
VLNADDPMVAEMAAATDARVVYFSINPNNPVITAHLAENGWCVFVEAGNIVLATGEAHIDLVELDRLPFTYQGKVHFQIMNALAATAAAWAAGLNPAMIVRALTTFKTDSAMVPGRFNVSEVSGVEVVLDYGHNPAAVKALVDAVEALGRRKTVFVLGLPGDRRDQDLKETIQATIALGDEYILHDLKERRGREKDEVPKLLRSYLPADAYCEFADDQPQALTSAWKRVKAGDRLVIIADQVDETIEVVQRITHSAGEDTQCDSPLASASSGH